MKTLKLFLFITLISTLTTNAQLTKGNWLLGGSGEYSNQTYKYDNGSKTKLENIAIKPSFGFFIKDKFVLGSSLRFEKVGKFHIYGIGVFSRYYFLKPQKTFNLFTQVHYDYVYTVSDGNENSQFYGARIGQVIFFNSVIGLEFSIGYERGELSSAISDNIKAAIGLQIHLEKN